MIRRPRPPRGKVTKTFVYMAFALVSAPVAVVSFRRRQAAESPMEAFGDKIEWLPEDEAVLVSGRSWAVDDSNVRRYYD